MVSRFLVGELSEKQYRLLKLLSKALGSSHSGFAAALGF